MKPHVSSWLPWYLLLALIWGSSFAFMKFALVSFTPAGIAIGRLALGAITLLIVMAIARMRLPSLRDWKPLFIAALLLGIPWMIFAFGQTRVSSTLAGMISSATPLVTLIAILVVFREERPSRARMVGLGVGLLGVLVVLRVWEGLEFQTWIGVAACLLAVVAYGIGYPYTRRYVTSGPKAVNASGLALSAALLIYGTVQVAPFAAVTGVTHAPLQTTAVLALVALGVLGSGLAYVLNLRVLDKADATTASTVTYMNPLVALAWGLALGEAVSWNEPVGALLVLIGAAIAQGLIRLPRGGSMAHRSPQDG